VTYRKAEIRGLQEEDRAVLFGLAALDRGADERTLAVLDQETVFVAHVDGSPAGYVALDSDEDGMRVDQLFVSPEHEGEGVGKQLLEYAEGFAISQGARRLRVVVAEGDERATAFYGGRGFVHAGENVYELVLPEP
jgi:GNAT superfamily N-acetyltransferase